MSGTAVIIPARWGSTRFPGKALHPIAGKPLVRHVWERASRAPGISQVIVATDDSRIADAAFNFGAEVAYTSPKHRSGTDRVAEVAKELRNVSHVINVQGDEPLIDPKLIGRLASAMTADPGIEMITAANPIETEEELESPNVVKVVLDRAANGIYFSRSPIPFIRDTYHVPPLRHQGIYGYTTAFLLRFVKWKPGRLEQAEQLEQLRALENGAKIRVLLTRHRSLGVDTPGDVAPVEQRLSPGRP